MIRPLLELACVAGLVALVLWAEHRDRPDRMPEAWLEDLRRRRERSFPTDARPRARERGEGP